MTRVSVIIPAWKRPALLREALTSVRSVQGSDLDIEIIVADNGMTHETDDLAREFGAIYLQNPVPGVAATRNVGAAVATGEYLMFLDEDDLWLPSHVRPHVALLRAEPGLGAVMGQISEVDHASLRPLRPAYPVALPASGDILPVLPAGGLQIGALVTRTSIWKAIGPFDESLTRGHTRLAVDDWDWYLRLALHYRVGFVAEPCLLFRIRPPSPEADTIGFMRQTVGRQVFWSNVRRAGYKRVPLHVAASMWLRHDGGCAGKLMANAGGYVAQGDYDAARQALIFAARVSPLHVAWLLIRSTYFRYVLWQLVGHSAVQAVTHR